MNRQRYMIFEHPKSVATNSTYLAIHGLLANYHWARLDDTHVLVIGSYSVNRQKHLDAVDKLSILPHLASAKAIHNTVKKITHWHSLKNALGLEDTSHTMTDVVDEIEASYGVVFGPLR